MQLANNEDGITYDQLFSESTLDIHQVNKKSSEDKQKNAQLITKSAVKTDKLAINNCKADPYVPMIAFNDVLTITNNDQLNHILTFSDEMIFEIPQKQTVRFRISPSTKTGMYGFSCDGQDDQNHGGILVVE